MMGSPATHAGGSGGPLSSVALTHSATRALLSAISAKTTTKGATSTTVTKMTVTNAAREGRMRSASRTCHGHSVTARMTAQRQRSEEWLQDQIAAHDDERECRERQRLVEAM